LLLGVDTDAAALKRAEEAFHRDAPVLDAHLAQHEYLAGGALSLADFSVASYLHYAAQAGLPLEPYGNIRAWYARIEALPAWQQTAPKM
jgi:glutathione S-transferase